MIIWLVGITVVFGAIIALIFRSQRQQINAMATRLSKGGVVKIPDTKSKEYQVYQRALSSRVWTMRIWVVAYLLAVVVTVFTYFT